MKAKGLPRFFNDNGKKTKALFAEIAQFLLGFVFSNVVIDGEFAPLGVAYSVNCSFMGLLGTIFGHMSGGCDVWRYLIACVVVYFARQVLFPYVNADDSLKKALFALWSMLLAGVCGNIFDTYTFKENILFFVSAIFSGFFAYVFSLVFRSVKQGRMPSSRIMCISFISVTAIVFLGLLSFGGIAENAGCILIFLLFFCLVGRASILYVSTVALIYSFALCLFSQNYLYLAGIIILGSILACLLNKMGQFINIFSFLIAAVIFNIYYPSTFSFWVIFYDILIAGAIFFLFPSKICDRIFCVFIPPIAKNRGVAVHRRVRIAADNCHEPAEPCSDCDKRISCWQANYQYTSDVFNHAATKITSPDFSLPRRFCSVCSHSDKVIEWLRAQAHAPVYGCKVEFAKASLSRNGEIRCGDTAGMFITKDNHCVLCIADGMGTGNEAAKQSESVAQMLQTLISRGVEKQDALQLVNETLLKSGTEAVLGMDLAVIDLLNCRCEMLKADASPTFVIRRNAVYLLGSASLPMGMTDSADLKSSSCTLIDGDCLIMVSDGLVGDGTKYLSEFIASMFRADSPDCLNIASNIMRNAVKRRIILDDDITVIAARISANK